MNASSRRSALPHRAVSVFVLVLGSLGTLASLGTSASGCKKEDHPPPAGMVAEAGPAPVDTTPATPPPVDMNQCAGCQSPGQPAWTFHGIFADDKCTKPLAQTVLTPCTGVPTLGESEITYVEAEGPRKAGEKAKATLAEAPTGAHFQKSGKGCVAANEVAVNLTPPACGGQKVCRDATGTLACAGCRTLTGGCPDYEESRLYATFTDSGAKSPGGGGNLARLRACCAALSAEARRLGPSPEAGLLATAAAQCMAIASQAGPNGNAPEVGALRGMLAGRQVPAVCSGF